MEFFAKIIKHFNYFFKALHLRSSTGFWIRLSLNKYSLTCNSLTCILLCIVWYIFRTLSITYYLLSIFLLPHVLFRHIVAYLEPCMTLAYSEPCNIQNPDIFRIQDMFRILSRHILVHSKRCVMLAYREPCHIQNFAIFRILGY